MSTPLASFGLLLIALGLVDATMITVNLRPLESRRDLLDNKIKKLLQNERKGFKNVLHQDMIWSVRTESVPVRVVDDFGSYHGTMSQRSMIANTQVDVRELRELNAKLGFWRPQRWHGVMAIAAGVVLLSAGLVTRSRKADSTVSAES